MCSVDPKAGVLGSTKQTVVRIIGIVFPGVPESQKLLESDSVVQNQARIGVGAPI